MSPRNQIRRLSHVGADRERRNQLLTRAGLDWTAKYPATAGVLAKLKVESPISTANFAVFVRMA
jgi:ATP-dependent DNA ligase